MEAKAQALGLPMEILKNSSLSTTPTSQSIADNLKPNSMTSEQMTELSNKFPTPEAQQAAMDILAHDSSIYSAQGLSTAVAEQHQKIVEYATSQGIKPKNIYYAIPEAGKSYGLITQQYATVNHISPDHILQPGQLPAEINATGEKTMMVVLDDVAASGQSVLGDVRRTMSNFNGPKVVSPLLSTEVANQLLGQQPSFKFLPQEIKPSFLDTSDFKAMSPAKQQLYKRVMGDLGYGGKGNDIAFPYMSPDNNSQFFATQVAQHYTLNGGGRKMFDYDIWGQCKFPTAPAATVAVTSATPTSHQSGATVDAQGNVLAKDGKTVIGTCTNPAKGAAPTDSLAKMTNNELLFNRAVSVPNSGSIDAGSYKGLSIRLRDSSLIWMC